MSNFTQPGNLKNRCKIVEQKKLQGDWGVETSEKTVAEFWCELRSQNLNEVQKNIGTMLEDTITIIIRYNPVDIIGMDMLVYIDNGKQAYNIVKYTRDINRKRFDTMIVKARS